MEEINNNITPEGLAETTESVTNEPETAVLDSEVKAPEKELTRKQKIIHEVTSWAIIIVVGFILATLINKYVLLKADVVSGSMRNTLLIDNVYLGNRLAYLFSDPERGDIVFFEWPDDPSQTYVKRIIGLPGEKVEIRKGKIYINDSETCLDEPYLLETPAPLDFGPVTVPENHYFMLGDNRNGSKDSRAWKDPYVSKDEILAEAWLCIWPPFSIVEDYDYQFDK